jgi:hypothetical protein
MQKNKKVFFRYTFALSEGREKKFDIELDPDTLEFKSESQPSYPEWTKLGFFPCDNCPLIGKVSHCPVAVNFSKIVESFQDTISYEPAVVTVETTERTYSKDTTVQKGLSSIIGICMVTSNCPVMDELRPMSRYHLPFATTEETLFRAVSYYLTRQYFVMKSGEIPDWHLDGLIDIYSKVSEVNKGIARRIAQASEKDANVNAIIILHSYGDSIPFFVEQELNDIRYLFQKFIK